MVEKLASSSSMPLSLFQIFGMRMHAETWFETTGLIIEHAPLSSSRS
jgi:hypothetical protein